MNKSKKPKEVKRKEISEIVVMMGNFVSLCAEMYWRTTISILALYGAGSILKLNGYETDFLSTTGTILIICVIISFLRKITKNDN